MAKVKIFDWEGELNIFEPKTARRVSEAIKAVDAKMEEISSEDSSLDWGETVERTCGAVLSCFNDIFGAGTDRAIFGDECDMLACVDAMAQLRGFMNENQVQVVNDKIRQYLPNRQVRRAAKR